MKFGDLVGLESSLLLRFTADLMLPAPQEGSREAASRVALARARQTARYAAMGQPGVLHNAMASANLIEVAARPDAGGQKLILDASERLQLSARGFHRVLKLARTIADLDESDTVSTPHIAEALSYRLDLGGRQRAA